MKFAYRLEKLKDTWKAINLLLNKRSKTNKGKELYNQSAAYTETTQKPIRGGKSPPKMSKMGAKMLPKCEQVNYKLQNAASKNLKAKQTVVFLRYESHSRCSSCAFPNFPLNRRYDWFKDSLNLPNLHFAGSFKLHTILAFS